MRPCFNTTGTESYRVQLAVPLLIENNYNNHNHDNNSYCSQKKLTNKYTEKLEFSTRVGTKVDQKKVLKQAGVVHSIKSQ